MPTGAAAAPRLQVVAAAALAAQELALLVPAMAVPLLPLLLFRARALVASRSGSGGGGGEERARAALALLRVLPAMGADQGVAAFALRALAPLLAPGAPVSAPAFCRACL